MRYKKLRSRIALLLLLSLLSGCQTANVPADVRAAADSSPVLNAPEPDALETAAPSETADIPETSEAPETNEAPETTEAPETSEVPETTEAPPDTEPPFFFYLSSPVTVERGGTLNLHNYIAYADNLDPIVELTVEGRLDMAAVGDYLLKLTLTDDAGNTATGWLTVRVAESVWTPPPASLPSKSFSDFTASYRRDGTMVGIDVSRWQGDIDFQQVAASGCEFVIIRIGGYAGDLFEDKYFAANLRNAKAAGLKVGVYWYSEEYGPEKVREDADYLYSLLDGEELDFPVFFDWEDFVHFEEYQMSLRDLNEMFLAFREEAEARGYRAALYNSKNFLNMLWSEEVKADGVWLAHYTSQTDYQGRYFLWQQGLGRIAGISGDVDVDVFYPGALP